MKFSDGILEGEGFRRGNCGICQQNSVGMRIDKVKLEHLNLKPSITLLVFERSYTHGDPVVELVPIQRIGISCGCYAKFHRQIGHITTRRQK